MGFNKNMNYQMKNRTKNNKITKISPIQLNVNNAPNILVKCLN